MKIRVTSDLHFEFFGDFHPVIDEMDATGIEVLIIAGDLCTKPQHEEMLTSLSEKFPQVIFVLGNHDYYRSSLREVHRNLVAVSTKLKNVQWLHNTKVEIGGHRFLGTPLWFRDDPMNPIYEKLLNDFSQIDRFRNWVYKENKRSLKFLEGAIEPGDIVITHHAPTMKSVPERYLMEPLNRFFVCDMESLIRGLEPRVWVHGHTHDSFDYMIEKTRIVCNPRGYRHYVNPGYVPDLTIEL